jgi:putative heme-binding domain-containing protein
MVLGRGKDIGPDLSQIGLKYERAALLDTILYPSKAVAHEYVPHIIQTDAHGVIAAFIVQETPRQLMVKTENGARLTINRADIIDMARQETSLMPELLLGGVTVQDAADLLAYLAGLKQAMATVTHWRGVGPFPNRDDKGLTTPFGPERDAAAPDLNAAYSGLNNRDVRWTTTQTREINGYQILDMVRFCRQQKARTDNVVCYFLTYIDSPQAQDASLLVGSDDGRRVWLNGRLVNEKHAHSAVRFGEQTVNVKLENGRNTLLVKVEQGNGDAGLAMAILSQATVTLATE